MFHTDVITPVDQQILSDEERMVTLRCSYDTNATRVRLYWYRQYPHQPPQFLLWKGARYYSDEQYRPNPQFSSSTSQTSTDLHISNPTLADSALYYCALRAGPVIQTH